MYFMKKYGFNIVIIGRKAAQAAVNRANVLVFTEAANNRA